MLFKPILINTLSLFFLNIYSYREAYLSAKGMYNNVYRIILI